MAAGLILYVVYRRRQGLDLTTAVKIPRGEPPAGFHELAYRSALVPVFGSDVSGRAIRAAARLVGEGATVEAVYVLPVPAQLSLDAGLEEEETQGRLVLEAARVVGKRVGIEVQTSLLRTRHPGRAIAEEARRTRAEVVYLATAHAPAAEKSLGATARYLLAERPCRVVVETGVAPTNGVTSAARSEEQLLR
jgi:APA family basic amino acid/polyamine antiporter